LASPLASAVHAKLQVDQSFLHSLSSKDREDGSLQLMNQHYCIE
jgi:hypothetical protein